MMTQLDLEPPARAMAQLLTRVTDDQLAAPTPCPDYTLGDLIEHVAGLSQAFTAAARKDLGPGASQGPSGDAARLGDHWRNDVPDQLSELAEAWARPEAWDGMTRAGGIDLPGDVAGMVALNELVVHGWDIARASGQPYDVDQAALDVSMRFVSLMSQPGEEAGREGLFGPVVDVPAEAPRLDRVIGLAGRDPGWPSE